MVAFVGQGTPVVCGKRRDPDIEAVACNLVDQCLHAPIAIDGRLFKQSIQDTESWPRHRRDLLGEFRNVSNGGADC